MLSHEIMLLVLALTAGLIVFTRNTAPRTAWARLGAVLLMDALTAAYIVWRYQETLPVFAWTPAALWCWFFFAFEMFATAYEVWTLFVMTRFTDHSPAADIHERRLRAAAQLPIIDIFIPTYSEPAAILELTIRGTLALDYPRERVRVWFLDDSRRPWLKELCARYGVGYYARPTNEHGKAGNLNYALPRTSGEYLLVIDADFILQPNILFRMLGFLLYEERIGLVQTPQHFRNPDPIQHNLFGAAAWTEEQHFFMTVTEPARDAFGNAFCVGSGWLVPRRLLEELGGFPQASICEDLEITYALRGRGYRTLFLNEALAYGLAPESVPEYVKQRVRWCSGTLQHLFLATGPLRARNLSLLDRLFYLETCVYWLTCPFIVLMLLVPIIFWFTGVSVLHARTDEAFLMLAPRLVAGYILGYWLSEGKLLPPITTIQKVLPVFHLTGAIAKSLVRPFGNPFKVTIKGQDRSGVVVQWSLLWIFLVLAGALLTGMFINLSGYHETVALGEFTALDVFWSLYTLFVLTACAWVCVELPKKEDDTYEEVLRANVGGTIKSLVRSLFR